jgi:hypothetical protein
MEHIQFSIYNEAGYPFKTPGIGYFVDRRIPRYDLFVEGIVVTSPYLPKCLQIKLCSEVMLEQRNEYTLTELYRRMRDIDRLEK